MISARLSKSSLTFPKVGSELYRCFLKHLVQLKSPTRDLTVKTATQKSAIEKAEGLIVRAFSEELTKLGFYGLLPMLGRQALKEFGIQVGLEGLGRLTGLSHRSGLDVMKDTASNMLFHAPMSAAGSALQTMPNGGVKNIANWLHNKASWSDPMSYSLAGRAASEGIGMGVKALTQQPKLEQEGAQGQPSLGKPQPLQQMGPSYQQLRSLDPRVVSSQYYV